MIKLTPELWAISVFHETLTATILNELTRELDFNLARRSGIVINQIRSSLAIAAGTTTGFDDLGAAVQELDVDPDNVQIWPAGVLNATDVEYDSSRVYRQTLNRSLDTASGTVSPVDTTDKMDWTNLRMEERPISITALRHHVAGIAGITSVLHAELYIKYHIVELSLEELGILNASRR